MKFRKITLYNQIDVAYDAPFIKDGKAEIVY